MASVDTTSTVDQSAFSGLQANAFADSATSDGDAASGGGAGNEASAEARSFGYSNEFLNSILKAGNYCTAEVRNDREERLATEIDPEQQPETARAVEMAASPEAAPGASAETTPPAMLAERLQDAPQPAIAQSNPSFGALLAGAGICLSSQLIGTSEHVPDSCAMELTPASVAAVGQDTELARV